MSCKWDAVRLYSWGLPVFVLAYIDSSESCNKAETELCKHLHCQQPSTARLNAKRVAGAPPSALFQFTCKFTTSPGQITSQLSASGRSGAAAEPPPHCVAQLVGQPQIYRSLSLSSAVSPTKRYRCLWSFAKAYFCSLLGILTQELLSLGAQLKHD